MRAVRHSPETLLEHQTATSASPFASSREAHGVQDPRPSSGSRLAAGCRGQISGWKARATFIPPQFVVHSCPFVVQTTPFPFPFASSRLRVRPTACKPRSPQRQSAVSRSQRTHLGLERPNYIHSCPFVVQRHPCVSFASSRLRVRPTACKTPVPAAAVRRQPVAEARSRAGKPELPAFVPIRVQSWFNVTPAFPSRLRVFA